MRRLFLGAGFTLALVTIAFFGCNKDNTVKPEGQYSVSQNEAMDVAKNFISLNSTEKKSSNSFKIDEVIIYNDQADEPALYVVKFKNKGFAVISATKKEFPVLAYSEKSKFDRDKMIPALDDWFSARVELIENLKKTDFVIPEVITEGWDMFIPLPDDDGDGDDYEPIDNGGGTNPDGSADDGGEGTWDIVEPLLETTWSQGCGYNTLIQEPGNSAHCDLAPTGCIPTAMAQIMNYHEHPACYHWDLMPNTFGTLATAELMLDIGTAIDINYDEDGSGIFYFLAKTRVPDAFINTFNYSSSVRYLEYEGTSNYLAVTMELGRFNRPVFFRGGKKEYGIYTHGHAWVCDGYRRYSNGTSTYLHLHMNWGRNNGANNAWYAFNNFNPGSSSYNYKSGIVVGIKP